MVPSGTETGPSEPFIRRGMTYRLPTYHYELCVSSAFARQGGGRLPRIRAKDVTGWRCNHAERKRASTMILVSSSRLFTPTSRRAVATIVRTEDVSCILYKLLDSKSRSSAGQSPGYHRRHGAHSAINSM